MTRSNYSDDLDPEDLAMWRGQVASAIRGKRGQRLLRDLVAALDAMPEKVLVTEELVNEDGDYCALGAVGARRGIGLADLDPEDFEAVAKAFDIAEPLAREVMWVNDEVGYVGETPAQRWQRVRDWASKLLKVES